MSQNVKSPKLLRLLLYETLRERNDRSKLLTFPRQALNYKDGCFHPSISRDTKPHLLTEIKLHLPEFIDSDWVKEVTVRPYLGELWIDWVIVAIALNGT